MLNWLSQVKQRMRQEALHVLRTAASDEDEPAATAKSSKSTAAQPIPASSSSSSSSASRSASAQHPSEAEPTAKSAKSIKKKGKAPVEIADVEMPFGYRKVQPLDFGLTAEEVSAY